MNNEVSFDIKCNRCKSHKVYIEGGGNDTFKIVCKNCGRWKFCDGEYESEYNKSGRYKD